jgi:dTDP-4-amino-4,6-dideoxygalactose transaminase
MIGHEELLAVERVMKANVLSDYQGNWSDNFYGGTEIKALEKEWAEYFGVKHAIACNSATSGLWMALNSIGLKQGDEVIVSPYTMTCSASLPLLFGAKPVFADIEPDYFCIDPDDIIKKINDKTRAIIAVDIFGQPCNFDRINEIAKR